MASLEVRLIRDRENKVQGELVPSSMQYPLGITHKLINFNGFGHMAMWVHHGGCKLAMDTTNVAVSNHQPSCHQEQDPEMVKPTLNLSHTINKLMVCTHWGEGGGPIGPFYSPSPMDFQSLRKVFVPRQATQTPHLPRPPPPRSRVRLPLLQR